MHVNRNGPNSEQPFILVSRMNCVVEIDASQDREHVGLQERDQQFERGQRNGQCQWHNAADPTYCAEQGDGRS